MGLKTGLASLLSVLSEGLMALFRCFCKFRMQFCRECLLYYFSGDVDSLQARVRHSPGMFSVWVLRLPGGIFRESPCFLLK